MNENFKKVLEVAKVVIDELLKCFDIYIEVLKNLKNSEALGKVLKAVHRKRKPSRGKRDQTLNHFFFSCSAPSLCKSLTSRGSLSASANLVHTGLHPFLLYSHLSNFSRFFLAHTSFTSHCNLPSVLSLTYSPPQQHPLVLPQQPRHAYAMSHPLLNTSEAPSHAYRAPQPHS